MSADDFKAQATLQSIGATSIPSQESFGTATLANNRRVTLSSGIVSRAGFTTNSSLAEINNLAISSGIASSEIFLNNNTFGLNTYFTIPSIGLLLRDAALTEPTLTSSIGITLNPINSEEVFSNPIVGNVRYISFSGNGISSSEILGTHTFNANVYVSLDTGILSDENFSTNNQFSLLNSLYPSSIASSEALQNNNLFGNISYISFSGNGINSLENLGTHSLKFVSYLNIETPIPSQESFNTDNSFTLFYNVSPDSIASSEAFQNNNLFGSVTDISLNSGIESAFSSPVNASFNLLKFDQQISIRNGIASQLNFGPSITFYPPLTSYFGFIYGYTVIVNNILVTLERENILDTVTKIPRKIENLQTRSESLNSFIETKNPLTSNIDIVYSIESEIVPEQTVIARQSKCYLESYIKKKYKIISNIYVEQNDNFYSIRSGKIN